MPEYPDIEVYLEKLSVRIQGHPLERIRLANPFFLRSVDPPPAEFQGRAVLDLRRMGKRIVLAFPGELFLVLHLMIAGRLHWREPGCRIPRKYGLCALDFDTGCLLITEAGSIRRASLQAVRGSALLAALDPGGLEVMDADAARFKAALKRENHTLKRALTDPRIFSGIGNAYSDEILHRARLSPAALTGTLPDEAVDRLRAAAREVLSEWRNRLSLEAGAGFPDNVTAFREGMAVHGRYGKPCPVCGEAVQRIRYADNETDYCAVCQTGGRLLADRALSRLLKKDWPRTPAEMEEMRIRREGRPDP